jgi:hypothetical protein
MPGSSATFGRHGVTCKGCGANFSVLWDMHRATKETRDSKLVEILTDPFEKKCPACKQVYTYVKSEIGVLVSRG